jgi:predicted DsbA family dithiol-disulfide isomerase
MRQLKNLMPEVAIEHRSFALVKDAEDFNIMFGSREAAKQEIMSHWEAANRNDDQHRFNIEGMKAAYFPFPSSMKVLIASKAAYFTAGDMGYWDVFDVLQQALFVENQNIEEEAVIFNCVRRAGIDFEEWYKHYKNKETEKAVEKDLILAKRYHIHSVPCLVINEAYKVSGAQPLQQIINAIQKAGEDEGTRGGEQGAACRLDNGKFQCD